MDVRAGIALATKLQHKSHTAVGDYLAPPVLCRTARVSRVGLSADINPPSADRMARMLRITLLPPNNAIRSKLASRKGIAGPKREILRESASRDQLRVRAFNKRTWKDRSGKNKDTQQYKYKD